jgi:hypothetical protein
MPRYTARVPPGFRGIGGLGGGHARLRRVVVGVPIDPRETQLLFKQACLRDRAFRCCRYFLAPDRIWGSLSKF